MLAIAMRFADGLKPGRPPARLMDFKAASSSEHCAQGPRAFFNLRRSLFRSTLSFEPAAGCKSVWRFCTYSQYGNRAIRKNRLSQLLHAFGPGLRPFGDVTADRWAWRASYQQFTNDFGGTDFALEGSS
jgi:hypothetical protein